MAQDSRPLLEFPCQYPIKVMGVASEHFREQVLAVFNQHAEGFDLSKVKVASSSKGRFVSVHVVIEARGPEHIDTLYQALKTLVDVRLVI